MSLQEPQSSVSQGQWVRRMAGALLGPVAQDFMHVGQCWWEGKMEIIKEIEGVLDAFIFQHIPALHNSKVNAFRWQLTKTSSFSVKCLAIDQLLTEMWRQLS